MKLETLRNKNYCASIVKIENIIPLEGCDNIQATLIFGNSVIVSKDCKVGDIGIFFPIECSIKPIFLSANNLYRDKTLNVDKEKSGFFELNGRVRCMKLRGYKSEGFFTPLHSLGIDNPPVNVGDDFDHINGIMICEKYIVPTKNQGTQGDKKSKADRKLKRFDRLIDGQFHFHIDTGFLAKELHKIKPEDIISISEKIHGTSAIASYILCNKKLSWGNKIAKKLGCNIKDTEYDYVYSSRKVIKNRYINPNAGSFYNEDIWKTGFEEIKPFLQKGMTIYFEICGFLNGGQAIQKRYDYGCKSNQHENYVYRITSTNEDGKVFEWSMLQIQQWCKANGLKAVPLHYYGYAKDLYPWLSQHDHWNENFLDELKKEFLEKDCTICKNKVPAEGIVLRVENLNIEPYKLKSFLFKQLETKMIDDGIENIEDNQEI